MKRAMATILAGCMLTLNTGVSFASEQGKVTSPDAQPHYGILKGKWVRPDGGYTITIKAVDVNGELDASYANPNPLPFSKSVASRDGNTIQVFLELSAGGYNGSTYTLNYVPSQDILKGIYFQAVAHQKYEVYFERVSESK